MALRSQRSSFLLCALGLVVACGSTSNKAPQGLDTDGNSVADDLGKPWDGDGDNIVDSIDINKDGTKDGPAIDTNGDGVPDGLLLDVDCDGFYESVDIDGDGEPNLRTGELPPPVAPAGCKYNPVKPAGGGGSGGSSGGGSGSTGGSGTTGGSSTGTSTLGMAQYQGTGTSTLQYEEQDVFRNNVGYKFIANGWGDNWKSHKLSWNGTSFKVLSLDGTVGANYSPAGYPTMFCGYYSMKQSGGSCGLPGAISSLKQVRTGWRWAANGNSGQYNAAWDIWLGNGNSLSAYLMVWLRDPPGQQPAGSAALSTSSIEGLPGSWNIWVGNVNGHPIVNYVKAEGQDLAELEFDVLDVYRDAIKRGYNLPGSNLMAVAVGYEVWNGPITNLATEDFYVDVK